MSDDKISYLAYEQKLEAVLIDICRSKEFVEDQLIVVDELIDAWHKAAPEYVADAIPQIKEYPTVAIAWAGYFGMAVATLWDKQWEAYARRDELYTMFSAPRGFDSMDEYILEETMGIKLDSKEALELEDLMRNCAYAAVAMIRKECVEPQTKEAFHIFARSAKVLFKIGVAVRLKQLGYRYEKVVVQASDSDVVS